MVADEEILLRTLNLSSVCYMLKSYDSFIWNTVETHILYFAGLNNNLSFYLLAEILLIAVRRSKPFFDNMRKIQQALPLIS